MIRSIAMLVLVCFIPATVGAGMVRDFDSVEKGLLKSEKRDPAVTVEQMLQPEPGKKAEATKPKSRWWIWALAGVLVAGGAAVAFAGGGGGGGGSNQGAPGPTSGGGSVAVSW